MAYFEEVNLVQKFMPFRRMSPEELKVVMIPHACPCSMLIGLFALPPREFAGHPEIFTVSHQRIGSKEKSVLLPPTPVFRI